MGVGCTSAFITWRAPRATAGATLLGYEINAGVPYFPATNVTAAAPPGATSASIDGLSQKTDHSPQRYIGTLVAVYDVAGATVRSRPAHLHFVAPTLRGTAYAEGFCFSDEPGSYLRTGSCSAVTLGWNAPHNEDGSVYAAGAKYTWSLDSKFGSISGPQDSPDTSAVIGNLVAGTRYYFSVSVTYHWPGDNVDVTSGPVPFEFKTPRCPS
jgi:hypothetical protein